MDTPQKHIKLSSTEDKIETLLKKAFTESFPIGLWILTLLISPVLLLVLEGRMFSSGNAVQNILTVYFFTFILSLITSIPTMIVFYFVFKFLVKRINVWWMAFTVIAFPMFGVITTLYLVIPRNHTLTIFKIDIIQIKLNYKREIINKILVLIMLRFLSSVRNDSA